MCIALIKPAESKLPSEEVLRRCFTANRDGAGFAYAQDSRVHFEKGLMTIEALLERIKLVPEGLPMLIHFRIGTHGGKGPEYTHPFPFTHDTNSLYMLSGKCNFPMMIHNGIIAGYGTACHTAQDGDTVRPMSDTQDFIHSMSSGKLSREAAKVALGAGKVAFLSPDGKWEKWGEWQESEGVWFSNSSYKPYAPPSSCNPTLWSRKRGYYLYNSDDYDEGGNYIPYSRRGKNRKNSIGSADQGTREHYHNNYLNRNGLDRSTPVLTCWGEATTIGNLIDDYGLFYYNLELDKNGDITYCITSGRMPFPIAEMLLSEDALPEATSDKGDTSSAVPTLTENPTIHKGVGHAGE